MSSDEPAIKKTRIQAPGSRAVKFAVPDEPPVPTVASTSVEPRFISAATSSSSLASFCEGNYDRLKDRKGTKIAGPQRSKIQKSSDLSLLSGNDAAAAQSSSSASPAKSSGAGPQVEVINGQIVIKESSLIVGSDSQLPVIDYEEVEEGNQSNSRYSSFLDKRKTKSWGLEETRLFYHVLRQCGLEFSMMQSFFPNRTRKEIKAKFRKEERQHPELIKSALENTIPLEMTPFELQLGSKVEMDGTGSSSSFSQLLPPVVKADEEEEAPLEEGVAYL